MIAAHTTLLPTGWLFGYPWLDVAFPALAERIRASLAQSPWRYA